MKVLIILAISVTIKQPVLILVPVIILAASPEYQYIPRAASPDYQNVKGLPALITKVCLGLSALCS